MTFKNLTGIEVFVVAASGLITLSVIYNLFMQPPRLDSLCTKGYAFVMSPTGSITQIMDSQGKGIPCNK